MILPFTTFVYLHNCPLIWLVVFPKLPAPLLLDIEVLSIARNKEIWIHTFFECGYAIRKFDPKRCDRTLCTLVLINKLCQLNGLCVFLWCFLLYFYFFIMNISISMTTIGPIQTTFNTWNFFPYLQQQNNGRIWHSFIRCHCHCCSN